MFITKDISFKWLKPGLFLIAYWAILSDILLLCASCQQLRKTVIPQIITHIKKK